MSWNWRSEFQPPRMKNGSVPIDFSFSLTSGVRCAANMSKIIHEEDLSVGTFNVKNHLQNTSSVIQPFFAISNSNYFLEKIIVLTVVQNVDNLQLQSL